VVLKYGRSIDMVVVQKLNIVLEQMLREIKMDDVKSLDMELEKLLIEVKMSIYNNEWQYTTDEIQSKLLQDMFFRAMELHKIIQPKRTYIYSGLNTESNLDIPQISDVSSCNKSVELYLSILK